jgi:hypothetical protein
MEVGTLIHAGSIGDSNSSASFSSIQCTRTKTGRYRRGDIAGLKAGRSRKSDVDGVIEREGVGIRVHNTHSVRRQGDTVKSHYITADVRPEDTRVDEGEH